MDLISYWMELSKNDEFLYEGFESRKGLTEMIEPFFFHCFRPTGEALEMYFDKHLYGKEIFKRLKKIFDATATNEPGTAYFIVDNAKILTETEIIALAENYIKSIRDMLQVMDEQNILSPEKIDVNIIEGCAPWDDRTKDFITNDNGVTENNIYNIKGEYFDNFETSSEFMQLHFCDCIYYMACCYDLVYYVLWPLFAEQSTIDNPYDAGFELWLCDLQAVFADNKTLNIYASQGIVRV